MPIYYVDATDGNNSWDGLAPSWVSGTNGPWQTVTKVNAFAFSAGDVCKFKCGETWATQLKPTVSGASGNHITFGTYNKGAGLKAKLTLGIDANGKSYFSFDGLHISGGRIWADSAEHHLYFYYCIIESTATYGFYGPGGPANILFYNCILIRNSRCHIYITGTASIIARNCIFLSHTADEGPFSIAAGGSLDLDYCLILIYQTISLTNVIDGGHNIWHLNPKVIAYPPTPIIAQKFVLTFDDNYIDEFESMVAGVFATYGIKATIFVNPGILTVAQKTKCIAFVAAGHEVANHSWCHEDLTATQAFAVTSTNTNPTVDVDVPGTTITLWCDEVGNRVVFDWTGDKTIADLKAAVAGKGWTITNSVQNGKTRQNDLKLDCLADSSGAQACPHTTLLDISAPNYKFWDHEINDAQDEIESITGVRPITLAYPYSLNSANLITWIKTYTDLKSCRIDGGAATSLAVVPIWKFISRSVQWTTASNEATVREYARRHWNHAIVNPAYFLYLHHETTVDFWTRFAWMINEIQLLGGEFCTYAQLITWIENDHVVNGDNWTKTYDLTGSDYHLLAASPCVNNGVDVGLTEDYDGVAVPQDGAFDIGLYEKFFLTLAGIIAGTSSLAGDMKVTMRLAGSVSGLSSLTANLTEVFSRLKAILFTAKPRERIITVPDRRRIRVAADRERIVTVDERK